MYEGELSVQDPHIMIVLKGKFKQEDIRNGWLIVNKKGKKARISDYNNIFSFYMKKAHDLKFSSQNEFPSSFPLGRTDFRQYSLRQSLRRGLRVHRRQQPGAGAGGQLDQQAEEGQQLSGRGSDDGTHNEGKVSGTVVPGSRQIPVRANSARKEIALFE
ncbi:hypothetical protein THAOC_08345, partial [Thalassiosira oceanica]